jgi:hypothetical protein
VWIASAHSRQTQSQVVSYIEMRLVGDAVGFFFGTAQLLRCWTDCRRVSDVIVLSCRHSFLEAWPALWTCVHTIIIPPWNDNRPQKESPQAFASKVCSAFGSENVHGILKSLSVQILWKDRFTLAYLHPFKTSVTNIQKYIDAGWLPQVDYNRRCKIKNRQSREASLRSFRWWLTVSVRRKICSPLGLPLNQVRKWKTILQEIFTVSAYTVVLLASCDNGPASRLGTCVISQWFLLINYYS